VSTWDVGRIVVTHVNHLEREEQGARRHALEAAEEDSTMEDELDEVDAWDCSGRRQ
jgi:hypothetical protein